jgi:poly(A) polymerase
MDIKCSDKELAIFQTIGKAAGNLNYPCYLIGGFVRDKILGRRTKDADFVCEGDGLTLAKEAASLFKPHPKVNYFKNFGTAQFKMTDGFDLEFVGARKESYRSHSRKPEVEPGTLEEDQKRRDFTINALAISLSKKDFGKLVDKNATGSLADL